ncbi:hypothetical protein [Arenicella xantha]|uniref:hypothetical protein n=1 Tax=Arenicella xantha TaxID=644221 RepID=UPI0011BD9861|nr:hypothetical protein [Arenicella xantha]
METKYNKAKNITPSARTRYPRPFLRRYRYAHSEPTEYAKADLDGFEYFSRDKEFVKIPWPKIQNISYSKFEAPSVKVELNYFETRPPYYGEISGYRNKQTNLFIQIDSKAKKVVDKIISLREKATTNEN